MRRYSPGIAILLGGLIAGTLDILYAIGFSAWRGTPPQRLLHFLMSATPNPWRFIPISFATGILVHMFFIGLPIAWAAARRPGEESG